MPVFLTLTVASVSAAATESEPSASLRAWRGDQPGGVVLAVVDQTGTHFFAEGEFSRTDSRRPDENTLFEVASLTKTFTALLLADAVQRGEVKLDDPIATRAGVKAPASITFESLATHHSGLPRLPVGFAPANPTDPYADQDKEKLWSALERAPLRKPGMRFEYSNFGAAVLGQSLAQTIRRPFGELLTERILQPLGMDSTGLDWRQVDRRRLAPGHSGGQPAPNWTSNAYAPAGAMVSSARDLSRVVEIALRFRESPLQAALMHCLEPRAKTERPGIEIGLAWMVESRPRGTTITWHNGASGGYRSFVGFDRAARIGVVLLTNNDTPLEPLAFALLARESFRPPEIAPPAPELAGYLGQYPLTPAFVLSVTAEGSQLFIQATGQPKLLLQKETADHFRVTGVDAEIRFERAGDGTVDALVLRQNGHDQRGLRRVP